MGIAMKIGCGLGTAVIQTIVAVVSGGNPAIIGATAAILGVTVEELGEIARENEMLALYNEQPTVFVSLAAKALKDSGKKVALGEGAQPAAMPAIPGAVVNPPTTDQALAILGALGRLESVVSPIAAEYKERADAQAAEEAKAAEESKMAKAIEMAAMIQARAAELVEQRAVKSRKTV